MLVSLGACQPCGDDEITPKIQFYNQSGASLVLGVFVKSPTLAQRLEISQNKLYYGEYSYDTENGEYLFAVDWRLSDYKYCRNIPFYYYGSTTSDTRIARNFREALTFYGTDSISLPVATSKYNLWKWLETHNLLYLSTLYTLSLQDLGPENNRKEIVCDPPLGCCLKIAFNSSSGSTAIGLYFHSETLGERLGTEQTDFMSIIGTRWRTNELKCPLGFGSEKTFGDFFAKCGTNEITFLFAESEDQLIEWEKSHNDNLLTGKQVYDINSLGPNESMIKIIYESTLKSRVVRPINKDQNTKHRGTTCKSGSGDGSLTHFRVRPTWA
jgi:hypothetical protein